MRFKIIACVNHVMSLGLNNELLYRIKSDIKNFRRVTINSVVIMGKNTYESLPKKSRPLSNRINIVITNDVNYVAKDCIVVHSIEECIELCEREFNQMDCYVIGGASMYQQFIDRDLVDTMYITEVNDSTEGDVFFPSVLMDKNVWRVFYQSDTMYDRESKLNYFFTIYKRKTVKED